MRIVKPEKWYNLLFLQSFMCNSWHLLAPLETISFYPGPDSNRHGLSAKGF